MPVVPLRWVLVRDPQGKLEPKAFLCTDLNVCPLEILSWFVRRWSVEVTFEEMRRHLGIQTQRQWSDLAIQRTTPCLLGLFSVVTLVSDELQVAGQLVTRQSTWYKKEAPTFSDALAAVRLALWRQTLFPMSGPAAQRTEILETAVERMSRALAYPT